MKITDRLEIANDGNFLQFVPKFTTTLPGYRYPVHFSIVKGLANEKFKEKGLSHISTLQLYLKKTSLNQLWNEIFRKENLDKYLNLERKDISASRIFLKDLKNKGRIIEFSFQTIVEQLMRSVTSKIEIEFLDFLKKEDTKSATYLFGQIEKVYNLWLHDIHSVKFPFIESQLVSFMQHLTESSLIEYELKNTLIEVIRKAIEVKNIPFFERGFIDFEFKGTKEELKTIFNTTFSNGSTFIDKEYYKGNTFDTFSRLLMHPFYIRENGDRIKFGCETKVACYGLYKISKLFSNLNERTIVASKIFETKKATGNLLSTDNYNKSLRDFNFSIGYKAEAKKELRQSAMQSFEWIA